MTPMCTCICGQVYCLSLCNLSLVHPEKDPGENSFVFMWSVSWCTLERVPGEDSFVFLWSVSWCILKRVPGEGSSCCLYVVCPLVHPEKGPRGRLVCLYVVCPLVLGCQGKACLSTCCLSPGVPQEAPGEGMSVRFVTCGQVNAQELTQVDTNSQS